VTLALPQVDVAELQAVLRAVRVRMEEAQAERPRGLAVGVLGFLALSLGFLHVAQGHAWSLSPRTVPPAKENDMKAIGAMAMAAAMGSGALAQDAVQWRVEDGGNGHWYLDDRIGQALTFSAREANARSRGAHLATITSAAEHQFVLHLAFPNGQIGADDQWPALGASHAANITEWTWVTNEPFEYNPYAKEPEFWRDQWLMMWGSGTTAQLVWTGNANPTLGFRAIIEFDADCNSDGIVDYGQIRDGELDDANTNNIPDCCEQSTACGCVGDADGSGFVNGVDLAAVLNVWGTDGGKYPGADINRDGTVNATDLAAVLNGWGACP
jgi:hypothetical protein